MPSPTYPQSSPSSPSSAQLSSQNLPLPRTSLSTAPPPPPPSPTPFPPNPNFLPAAETTLLTHPRALLPKPLAQIPRFFICEIVFRSSTSPTRMLSLSESSDLVSEDGVRSRDGGIGFVGSFADRLVLGVDGVTGTGVGGILTTRSGFLAWVCGSDWWDWWGW